MYKVIGFSLMSVFAMMIIPSNIDISQGGLSHDGAGTITLRDGEGNELFTQTIHNRLVDTGETFMLQATFQDTNAPADVIQIGSICISDAQNAGVPGTPTIAEAETATDFDGDNQMTENNCKEDTTVVISAGLATINPPTFTCGGTNCSDGDVVVVFAVCQNDLSDDLDFNNCATEGVLFALIDNSDTTLNTAETLDITYNFDISSSST